MVYDPVSSWKELLLHEFTPEVSKHLKWSPVKYLFLLDKATCPEDEANLKSDDNFGNELQLRVADWNRDTVTKIESILFWKISLLIKIIHRIRYQNIVL